MVDAVAQRLMEALGTPAIATSEGFGTTRLLPAAPPAGRLVLTSVLASVLFVNQSGGVAHGVQRWPSAEGLTHASSGCGAFCPEDPRASAWWAAATAGTEPRWSEIHLLGDQLALGYVLPLDFISERSTGGATSAHDGGGGGDGGDDGRGGGGWAACTMPLAALQAAFDTRRSADYATGFILQASGTQHGALVSSFLNDEEERREVGSSWFTLRRHPADSAASVRIAAEAVDYTLEDNPRRTVHEEVPMATPLLVGLPALAFGPRGSAAAMIGANRANITHHSVDIYRTHGAPRTLMTPLRGGDCLAADGLVASGGGGGRLDRQLAESATRDCGLDWMVVSLVNFNALFRDQDKLRTLSVCIFVFYLLVQLYVLQVALQDSNATSHTRP